MIRHPDTRRIRRRRRRLTRAAGISAVAVLVGGGSWLVRSSDTETMANPPAASTGPASVATATPTGGEPSTRTIADDFDRTIERGWDRTPSGIDWLTRGQAQFWVRDGSATMLSPGPKNGARGILTAPLAQDLDVRVDVSLNRAPDASKIYTTVSVREIGKTSYQMRLRQMPSGAVELYLIERVSGEETTIAASGVIPGLQAGRPMTLRMRATGATRTVLRGKVWPSQRPEPNAWTLTARHKAPELSRPGLVSLDNYLGAAQTRSPRMTRFDNLEVRTKA